MVKPIRIGIILVLCLLLGSPAGARSLEDRLKEAATGKRFRRPGPEELNAAETLFGRIFDGASGQSLFAAWARLGFDLLRTAVSGKPALLLVEEPTRREGRGFYLFRPKDSLPLALQVPHGFKDLDTDEIGLALAAEIPFAAVAWNTVPRYSDRNGARVDSDLAHLPRSYFTAFARAFAGRYPSSHLIQIHGYADANRKTPPGRSFDLILSSGTRTPGAVLVRMDRCIEERLSRPVALYPIEVKELGGTTNTIGRTLREIGYSGFIHIEMDRSVRLKMRDDPLFRDRFSGCLIQLLD